MLDPSRCREAFGSPEFPDYPSEQMTRSQTPVVTPTLAILTAHQGLLSSSLSTLSTFHCLLTQTALSNDHHYTYFGALY